LLAGELSSRRVVGARLTVLPPSEKSDAADGFNQRDGIADVDFLPNAPDVHIDRIVQPGRVLIGNA
jgi:hypothetical protein